MFELKEKLNKFTRLILVRALIIPRRTALTILMPLALVIILLQGIAKTDYSLLIDQKIFHPLAFQLREYLSPQKLDPRIKIFSLDNRTASYLHALDIPLNTWGTVIHELSKKEQLHIIIPKLFDSPYTNEEISEFESIVKTSQSKVSILAFTFPGEISYRQPISKTLILKNQNKILTEIENETELKKFEVDKSSYGAPAPLLTQFSIFGHNEYLGDNRTRPLIILKDGLMIPNAAMALADHIKISGHKIMVNQKNIHLDDRGTILVNFGPKALYQKRSYSFLEVIERAKKSTDISVIQNGDYVVILPAMFTGNTDFQETPFGSMPGGYLTVAVLQSVLSGQWLKQLEDPGVLILFAGVLGFLLGFLPKPRFALAGLFLSCVTLVTISGILFFAWGLAWSFVLPLVAVIFSSLAGIIVHNSVASIEEHRIQRELEVATLVQNSFFQSSENQCSLSLQVKGRFIPASECGGDWWGQFKKGPFHYVMIGDAIGHGVPAALVTAVAFSVTRTMEAEFEHSGENDLLPSSILSSINRVLCAMSSDLACMTFLVFRINEQNGECHFANAGNPQAVLIPTSAGDPRLANGQRTKTLLARGDVLGLSLDSHFQNHSIQLSTGDTIVLFTDGLIENKSEQTKKPLGKSWLKEQLQAIALKSDEKPDESLWTSYKNSVGRQAPDDDVTIVTIQNLS